MNIRLSDFTTEALSYLELAIDRNICDIANHPVACEDQLTRMEEAMCLVQSERMRRESRADKPTFCVVQ